MVNSSPSMRPASGQANRAVHTCSTVVHILVLRLSSPARYVAAPSLPYLCRARSASHEPSIVAFLVWPKCQATTILTGPSRPRTLERLPTTAARMHAQSVEDGELT